MKIHPLNLFLRLLLELMVLFFAIEWALQAYEGWERYVLMIVMPVLIATLWGVFNVPGDPSRSGKAVVAIPGWLRLILELLIFSSGAWFISESGYIRASWLFAAIVILHYVLSFSRIRWLIKGS